MKKTTRLAIFALALCAAIPSFAQQRKANQDCISSNTDIPAMQANANLSNTPEVKATVNPNDEKPNAAKPEQKVKASVYGFVRNYFNYDSRQTYYVCGGEYNMMPLDEDWNITPAEAEATGLERYDLNDVPQFHLLSLTTRIGLNLSGPGIWGAHSSSGKIEGDFAGFSTTNTVFRVRQAWAKLNWEKSELLVGQTWHPLSGDIMPEVLGMAAGAPFRCHSRTPQVRYIFTSGKLGFTAAAISQLQYMNNGPSWDKDNSKWTSTNSTSFAYNAVLPELFLGLNYKDDKIYAQLGADYQMLRPRTWGFQNVAGTDYKVSVNETVQSITPTVYFQYTDGLFALKFRSLLAQNTSHLNQLVGYAVTGENPDGSWNYKPMEATISYLNLAYGKKIRADLFFGYMQNLGCSEDILNSSAANIFMKGGSKYTNIQNMWRVCPGISYNTKAFNIGLEYELTGVGYGDKTKMQSNGTFKSEDVHNVLGSRICALVKYNF